MAVNKVLANIAELPKLNWAEVCLHSPVATVLTDGCDAGARIVFANEAASRLAMIGDVFAEVVEADPSALGMDLAAALPIGTLPDVRLTPRLGRPGHGRSVQNLLARMDLHIAVRPDGGGLIVQFTEARASEQGTTSPSPGADDDLGDRRAFRRALLELTDLSYTTHDDAEFYQRLLERAVEVVPGAQAGSVQMLVPGSTAFRFVAAVGFDLKGLQRHLLEPKVFFRDAWNPVAEIVRDFTVEGRSPEITEWLETVGRLSELVVNVSAPVLVDELPVAFLSLDNFEDPEAMTEESVEMTTVLSRLIGDLWRRRELEAELRREREAYRHLALHDPLTKLANRRNLERTLEGMIEGARRRGRPSAVLFVDVDDFKGVNDRLGHPVGDAVLLAIASGLTTAARAGDVVGRWGGDEFLLLPHRMQASSEAEDLAQRVLKQFESPLELDDGLSYRVRVSIGVGWCAASKSDVDELVGAADEALYDAKAAGKGVARLRLTEQG